ncbi:MAG: efflux RND transporter periplasmic adaptor subunit [Bacteroidetes bacterium]|nr:efflux RND transporter periplasmic adaptor subunit [Bacteroidota bacterium]
MKNIFLIIIVSLLLLSCGSKETEQKQTETANTETTIKLSDVQIKNSGIVLGKTEMRSISTVLKVNGKIDVPPQNMVSISVPLGGYLKSTKLLPGMKVKKGEVIANIEDQQYIQLQQDYLTAKSKLSYLEKEYQRQKELNQSKASSDKVFQETETTYQGQKILVKSLSEKLRLISINPDNLDENNLSRSINLYAPIDGFVSTVNVNIGKYVTPSDVLFELVNPSDIHLALTIFEKDINKLSIGQKLMAYTNNEPDKKHPCEILLIGQNLSAERSVEVHCHFNDYDKTLIPGMYMNADIEVKANDVIAVPTDAIVHFEGKDYVFVQDVANTFIMTEVQSGASENGFTEVINANEIKAKSIVVKGAYTVLMSIKNKAEE